eukprot:TRINITY_DN38231_c0_g1_i2.p2 TRINITY_DN38231_c0_g1~~TRINITY_DN38231_c0_g1_i2.p2  ORF type:complete len:158 (-),score=2.66 TRINITY_DN38231_c0_g1_i2:425-898(-)
MNIFENCFRALLENEGCVHRILLINEPRVTHTAQAVTEVTINVAEQLRMKLASQRFVWNFSQNRRKKQERTAYINHYYVQQTMIRRWRGGGQHSNTFIQWKLWQDQLSSRLLLIQRINRQQSENLVNDQLRWQALLQDWYCDDHAIDVCEQSLADSA